MLLITTSVRQGLQDKQQAKNKSTVQPGKFSLNITNRTYYIFHFLVQIVFKRIQFSKNINLMFWVLTIAIRANIVMQPGYNIHSFYRTTATRNCCLLGRITGRIDYASELKYLDTPDFASGCSKEIIRLLFLLLNNGCLVRPPLKMLILPRFFSDPLNR